MNAQKEHDITFSVKMEEELENDKTVTYEIKLINTLRFTEGSLSFLANNLADGLHKNKCEECKSCLEYIKDTYLSVKVVIITIKIISTNT